MYYVTAQLINAFKTSSEKYPDSYKLQLLGDTWLKDGQVKKDIVTLSVPISVFNQFKSQIGKEISLPCAFYVDSNNIRTFFPAGSPSDSLNISDASN